MAWDQDGELCAEDLEHLLARFLAQELNKQKQNQSSANRRRDFLSPRARNADTLKKANEALQAKYKAEGFPTILVLNGDGKEVWRQVGYMPGGPEAWIGKLKSLK